MISAKIICDSVSPNTDRIATFELEYPRFIHSELMTHRLFSRNAASSRAIPIEKMIDQVRNNPAMPVHWGKNQSGMQASEELESGEVWWRGAALSAAQEAEYLMQRGYHKQIVNRILEPFQWMKTVVTATEYDNFFWLRCHEDSQPEIKVLADLMYEEYSKSNPQLLEEGEWHLPYVNPSLEYSDKGISKLRKSVVKGFKTRQEILLDSVGLTLEQALKVSASCCAQVSFRATDDSLEKAERIYARLVESVPVHTSPFEHQATPIVNVHHPRFPDGSFEYGIEEGITHVDRDGYAWSGNFKGWIQNRQLIDNNVCWDYKGETK